MRSALAAGIDRLAGQAYNLHSSSNAVKIFGYVLLPPFLNSLLLVAYVSTGTSFLLQENMSSILKQKS